MQGCSVKGGMGMHPAEWGSVSYHCQEPVNPFLALWLLLNLGLWILTCHIKLWWLCGAREGQLGSWWGPVILWQHPVSVSSVWLEAWVSLLPCWCPRAQNSYQVCLRRLGIRVTLPEEGKSLAWGTPAKKVGHHWTKGIEMQVVTSYTVIPHFLRGSTGVKWLV